MLICGLHAPYVDAFHIMMIDQCARHGLDSSTATLYQPPVAVLIVALSF